MVRRLYIPYVPSWWSDECPAEGRDGCDAAHQQICALRVDCIMTGPEAVRAVRAVLWKQRACTQASGLS